MVVAGSYVHDGPALDTGWHSHPLHQLEYACTGTVGVVTETARFLLPPHQVAWIPAGTRHISTLGGARTISVFLDPSLVTAPGDAARVLAAAPLLGEMIRFSVRWPVTRTVADVAADAFFRSLALLLPQWLDELPPFVLPVGSSATVVAALAHTHERLVDATPAGVAREVGVSERTLRRLVSAETGMTWREYLLRARVLAARGLLADPDLTVLRVASAVGFQSAPAFARAFARCTGEAPSAYRGRVLNGRRPP